MAPSRQVRIQDEPAQDGDTDQDSEKRDPTSVEVKSEKTTKRN